jgi:uncharacterized membrane protein
LLLGVSFADAGALTLMISLIAMVWNVIFNTLFDRILRRWQKAGQGQRGAAMRVLHAVLFELGLILTVVPLAAWWLDIGLVEAFILDIGLILFFLPYTLVYNWCYDHLRANLLRSSQKVVAD